MSPSPNVPLAEAVPHLPAPEVVTETAREVVLPLGELATDLVAQHMPDSAASLLAQPEVSNLAVELADIDPSRPGQVALAATVGAAYLAARRLRTRSSSVGRSRRSRARNERRGLRTAQNDHRSATRRAQRRGDPPPALTPPLPGGSVRVGHREAAAIRGGPGAPNQGPGARNQYRTDPGSREVVVGPPKIRATGPPTRDRYVGSPQVGVNIHTLDANRASHPVTHAQGRRLGTVIMQPGVDGRNAATANNAPRNQRDIGKTFGIFQGRSNAAARATWRSRRRGSRWLKRNLEP